MAPPSPSVVREALTLSRSGPSVAAAGAPAGPAVGPPVGGPDAAPLVGSPAPVGAAPAGRPAPGTGAAAGTAAAAGAAGAGAAPLADAPAARRPGVPAARRPAPRTPGSGGSRRYRLRGRHIREHRMVRVGLALAAADIAVADDLLVLQVLRLQPLADLDPAQVCAVSALPPSIVASSLDRLVRSGLARDTLVDGRVRYGLP